MARGVQGFLIVIACLLAGAGAVGFAVGQSTNPATASVSLPVSQVGANQASFQQRTGLTIQEVMSWCRGTGCTSDHFQQLPDTSGIINPNGVLFMILVADQASDFNVPSGITVDPWNCLTPSPRIPGPIYLTHICQASFRKG